MNSRALLIRISVLVAASLVSARGQAVIGISPGSTAVGLPAGNTGSKGPLKAPLSSIKSAVARQGPLAQWGPLAVRPHLSYGLIYGNGILRVPGEPENTVMQTVSPGVLLELGGHVTLDYTVTRHIYSSRLLTDTTDHNAQLQGTISRGDWQVSGSQSYGSNSPTLVETGRQTAEKTYSTTATIAYELGPRSLIDTTLSRYARTANPLLRTDAWTGSDWTQWSASTWFRYSISSKLNVSLGFLAGYDEIRDDPDMSYTEPQIAVRWLPTEKLALNAKVGVERRKPRTSNARVQENAVHSASARYQIFETTGLSFGANRNVSASYFSDQTTNTEGWNIGADQRLLTRIFGSASYARGRTSYLPTIHRPFVERDDRYESYNVNLSTPLLRRGTGSIFFTRSRNRSNNQEFGFTTDQVGINFDYRF